MKAAFSSKISIFLYLVLLVSAVCPPMQGRAAVAPDKSRFQVAAERGDMGEVMRLLAQGVEADEKDGALIGASAHGRTEIVRLLGEKGANVNAQTLVGDRRFRVRVGSALLELVGGQTALMAAARGGYTETVKVLLYAGAKVNTKNARSEAALMQAVGRGHADTVKLLLAHGAEAKAKDMNGRTPLMRAADDPRFSDIAELEALITAGAEVNEKDNRGMTALMVAVSRWNGAEIVQLLLTTGADVDAKNKDGKTALILASESNRNDIVEVLKRAGAKE